MATGRFEAYSLTANNPQSLAQGTTDNNTVASVSIVNRGNFNCKVSIGITGTVNAISNLEYIDKDVELLPAMVLERTAIVIKKDQYITVSSDSANVSAVAWGVESGDAVSVTAIPDVTTPPIPGQFIATGAFSLMGPYMSNTHANGTSFIIIGNAESPGNPGAFGWAQGRLLAYDEYGKFSYGSQVVHPNYLASESPSRFQASDADSSGNVYVTGRHMNGVNVGDIGQRLTKLSGAGAKIWSKQIQDGAYSGNGWYGDGSTVAVSNDGNAVYVGGETRAGPINTGTNQQVCILGVRTDTGALNSSIGNAVVASTTTAEARNARMTMAPDGDLRVAWYESAQSRVLFAKLNATTYASSWCRKIAFTDNNSNTGFSIYDISCDADSNLYFIGSQGLSGAVIGKYNSSGSIQWTVAQDGLVNCYFGNHTIEAVSTGGCVVNMKVDPGNGTYEGYALRLDANGGIAWQYQFDNDYELNHATIIGDKVYSTDDDSRVHKVPLAGLTTPQTIPSSTVISTGTLAWNAPGTNGNSNLQPIRTRTEASSTISVDPSYSSPATYATASATYDIINTIGTGSNTVTNLS